MGKNIPINCFLLKDSLHLTAFAKSEMWMEFTWPSSHSIYIWLWYKMYIEFTFCGKQIWETIRTFRCKFYINHSFCVSIIVHFKWLSKYLVGARGGPQKALKKNRCATVTSTLNGRFLNETCVGFYYVVCYCCTDSYFIVKHS